MRPPLTPACRIMLRIRPDINSRFDRRGKWKFGGCRGDPATPPRRTLTGGARWLSDSLSAVLGFPATMGRRVNNLLDDVAYICKDGWEPTAPGRKEAARGGSEKILVRQVEF